MVVWVGWVDGRCRGKAAGPLVKGQRWGSGNLSQSGGSELVGERAMSGCWLESSDGGGGRAHVLLYVSGLWEVMTKLLTGRENRGWG